MEDVSQPQESYPPNERETVLRYDDSAAFAYVWSASKVFWRRMERLGIKAIENGDHGRSYRVPKTWVRVRKPAENKMSEEQRQIASERFKKMRAKQLGRVAVNDDAILRENPFALVGTDDLTSSNTDKTPYPEKAQVKTN